MNLFPSITDSTGNITSPQTTSIGLQPGFYLINYSVSALLTTPGYMQVTPSYNGAAHIEFGVYSRTGQPQNTAQGSATFIIQVSQPTVFTLTFSSNVSHTEGQLSLTILKLERNI